MGEWLGYLVEQLGPPLRVFSENKRAPGMWAGVHRKLVDWSRWGGELSDGERELGGADIIAGLSEMVNI
jgi:hypothetical protein